VRQFLRPNDARETWSGLCVPKALEGFSTNESKLLASSPLALDNNARVILALFMAVDPIRPGQLVLNLSISENLGHAGWDCRCRNRDRDWGRFQTSLEAAW